MSRRSWSWVGACSTGASHIKGGSKCQDAAGCIELVGVRDPALIVVVSDGAGSARFSAQGSRAVVKSLARCASDFLHSGGALTQIDDAIVSEWLDGTRDKLFLLAEEQSAKPRDFAATLVAAFVGNDRAVVCHVGDGACALRKEENSSWEILSWPAHGEYASSTYFVTDDPQPYFRVCHSEGRFIEVAAFSDGLERLALDFSQRTPFNGFLDPMLRPLVGSPPGRNRRLSSGLRAFLDSERVSERTDDDKTLVLARRSVVR